MKIKSPLALALAAICLSPMALVAADGAVTTATIKTKSGTIGAPEPGKGMIVFYRPGSMMGMALGCTVREGDQANEVQIARLGSGKYWVHQATPGKHSYRTEGEATDSLNMEIEAGETYFVRCKIGMGIAAGRANISPSTEEEFAKKAKGLKLWEPKGDLAEEKAKK